MSAPILATKLYVPPPRPKTVARPRLIERLEAGLHGKLTLVSAPAGFGKTTLVSAWLAQSAMPTAWLSLDEGESDPARFLTYFVAALQTIAPRVGAGLLAVLQSPQPPSPEMALTSLLNDIATVPERFILVLDDYHVIESQAVDQALAFLIEHLPPQMHLVITTREDPPLPLARLRVRGQLQEVRVADLRFTPEEAAGFLNDVMGLNLNATEIAALETRTEGWVAGLQLAALSMQGQQSSTATSRATFIESFSGGHHFVLDYLLEEVLHQQPAAVQTFLLHTSILARLCGPLCDAVLGDRADSSTSGQATLEYLERANLFLVPLDNERRWYRYHHLFAELLRQRAAIVHAAQQAAPHDNRAPAVEELHTRASQWFEEHGLDLEAFHHAVAANDVPRAARLVEGKGIPLHFRGAVAPVTQWIKSLPTAVLDATPMLWTALASASLAMGQPRGVPEALQAAEDALQKVEQTEETRDLIGRVAAIRATLAASQRQVETILTQSQRALEYLRPDNAAFRVFTIWKLGYAYHLRGERTAARNAYRDAIEAAAATGNHVTTILATIGLAALQAANNELHVAADNFRHALHMVADLPMPVASEAHFGLASIHYQWGELAAASASAERGLQTSNNDRISSCQLVLARVKLAEGDVAAAALLVEQAAAIVREKKLAHRTAEVAAAQVALLLRQGNVTAAAKLAQTHDLPLSEARVLLARGDAAAASALLAPLRVEMAARAWADELLQVMVLQARAHHAQGDLDAAVAVLTEALTLAAPGGYVRLFVDEGAPMQQLLDEVAARGIMVAYVEKLLAAFATDATLRAAPAQRHEEIIHAVHTMHSVATLPIESAPTAQATTSQPRVEPPLVEPLSQRELEVLQLTAQGLSNREIGERLFLALSTVKGHNRNIFGKLQVQRRTEAVARARALGLL